MFPKITLNKQITELLTKLISESHGLVILEYAVVAMIGLPLLLLLLDVGNVLRVKTSLQESVKRTLRCLTPLEADCIQTANLTSVPLYEVKMQKATTRWPLPEYLYSLSTEKLLGTKYQFDNPIAQVLDRVSYYRKDVEYLVTEKKDRLKVNLDYYLKTASLPYIETGSDSKSTLSPRFLYRKSLEASYPREIIDLSNVIGTVKNLTQDGAPYNKFIGQSTFTVPSLGNLPCFKSRNIDSATDIQQVNFNHECSVTQVPTVLFITGKFPVDSLAQGSRGKVKINLKGRGLNINGQVTNFKQFNLGGRIFTYDSNNIVEANFVPRGAPTANVSSFNNYQEFELYQNIILQAGETYTLEFYLQRTNEEATRTGWQGNKLRLFYGQHQQVHEEHYCEDSNILIQGTSANPLKTCQYLEVGGQSVPRNILSRVTLENYFETRASGCVSSNTLPPNCPDCFVSINQTKSCAGSNPITKSCGINFGVKSNPNTTSFAEAEKVCAVNDPLKVANFKQVYSEKNIVLPAVSLSYEQQSCTDSPSPKVTDLPESVRKYQKVSWNKGVVSVGSQIETKGIKPSKFKLDNLAVNCPAFQVQNKNFDFNKSQAENIPRSLSSSLLVGAHSELETGCNWKESVGNEAERVLGLSELDYLDVERALAGYQYVDQKPGISCYGYLPQKDAVVGDLEVPEKLGQLTKDQIPSACQDPDINCEIKFVGFQGQGEEDFNWDQPLAISKGYEALKAAYGGAKINCEPLDPNCFKMDINFDGRTFDVYASMELPLLSLLGKRQIKLNFRNQGIYQGALRVDKTIDR